MLASGEIEPTGNVDSFGGGANLDGPVPTVAGDLLYPGTSNVTIFDQSSLTIRNGSTMTAGSLTGDAGLADFIVTDPGSRLELSGAFGRLFLFGTGTFQILAGAVVDATDTSLCSGPCGGVVVGGLEGANSTLRVFDPGSVLDAIGGVTIGESFGVDGPPLGGATGTVLVGNGGGIISESVAISVGAADDLTGTSCERIQPDACSCDQ
jgi:hypothetical protein